MPNDDQKTVSGSCVTNAIGVDLAPSGWAGKAGSGLATGIATVIAIGTTQSKGKLGK